MDDERTRCIIEYTIRRAELRLYRFEIRKKLVSKILFKFFFLVAPNTFQNEYRKIHEMGIDR
jgi:hypothetical protein